MFYQFFFLENPRNKQRFFLLLICCILSFFATFLRATDYVWDGGAATTDWTDSTNWDQAGYPDGNDDTATFNSTSNQNANIPSGLKIGALTISGTYSGTVTLDGSVTLDNSGGETGNFTLSSL